VTSELIRNDFIEDGSSLMEVLIPPLKQGLKRFPKERKTRIKDLHYHLENLNKVMRNYSNEIASSQDVGSLKSSQNYRMARMSEVLGSPQSSRPSFSSISKRSFSLRKSNSIQVRPMGLPTGTE